MGEVELDSCGCMIGGIETPNPFFIRKCPEHNIPEEALTHNRTLNSKFGIGIEPTESQTAEIMDDKKKEKDRIKEKGEPVILKVLSDNQWI